MALPLLLLPLLLLPLLGATSRHPPAAGGGALPQQAAAPKAAKQLPHGLVYVACQIVPAHGL